MVTIDDIKKKVEKNFSLEECAKLLHVSPRTIQRICKKNGTFYTDLRSHLSPHNTPGQDGANLPGTPLKLTEEILETALVHALRDDPIKAIGPALQFLDKKKGLSIEGADTKQSLIAADKLKSIRKDMFS